MQRKVMAMAAGGIAALAAAGAGPALAAGAHATAGETHFVETESGTGLSVSGSRFEDLFRVKTGPFKSGTVVRNGFLTGDTFPASGKDTATSYYLDGRLIANETITLGAPLTDGVGTIAGTGTCASGTYKHQGETCTYTIKGSYDLLTNRMYMTLSGTYTPSSTSTKKK